MAPPVAQLLPVPFREAIAAFRRRAANPQVSDRWTDRMHDEHSAQLTVARSIGYDILGDLETAMAAAFEDGTGLAEFSKTLVQVLKAKGWWGKVERADGEIVQLGSQRRLATIFNVNMRVSHAAGRWEQIQRTKLDLPYLMYSAILDRRTRPQHRAWHGTILPVDHAWWMTHYPPCGWNCRCSVIQLTEAEARRRGITAVPPSGPPRRWFNPSTGNTIEVPHGIDPGWGFNVGIAAAQSSAQDVAARMLADKLVGVSAEIAVDALGTELLAGIGRELASWAARIRQPVGDARVVGVLPRAVIETTRPTGTGAIVLEDRVAATMPSALLSGLPRRLASPLDLLMGEGEMPGWVVNGSDGGNYLVHVAPAGPKGGNLITGWQPFAASP